MVTEMISAVGPDAVSEEILIERAHGNVSALPRTIAGALAYCTFIPAIVFLLVEPFNKDRFIRFHSYQSIGMFLFVCFSAAVLRIASALLGFIPIVGPLLVVLLWMIVGLGIFILWLVLVVKALQGMMFKLPFLGGIAEQLSVK
jgi:uncharacterized membrane protein